MSKENQESGKKAMKQEVKELHDQLMALQQRMTDAAVEGTVALLLLIRQNGEHRSDITEHGQPPQASYAPSSFPPSGAEV